MQLKKAALLNGGGAKEHGVSRSHSRLAPATSGSHPTVQPEVAGSDTMTLVSV